MNASDCPIFTIDTVRVDGAGCIDGRGWQMDKVLASIEGVEVGYLNISFIPRVQFQIHYGAGLLSFVHTIKGYAIFERMDDKEAYPHHDFKTFPDACLGELVRNAAWLLLEKDFSREAVGRMSRRDLMGWMSAVVRHARKRFGNEFDAFKAYHVDAPQVDFIRVIPQARRMGVAMALYAEGSAWMREKSMRLHASARQQEGAAGAWLKMESKGWVASEGGRRFLTI